MSLFYSIAYRLGLTPWEHAATHPPAVEHITRLFEREEQGRQPPYGRALDLGCGTGHWAVTLAQRGWQVTGVELVPKAVRAARDRVRSAGVEAEIMEGDVTALRQAGVGDGFRLIWDFGTIHGLTDSQRASVAREVDAVTTDDAAVLILAWAPGRRGFLPRGMSRREIEESFRGWSVTDEEPFDATGLPGPLRGVDPRVYRLRRV
ncbi:MAG TPA: class I SAM-dependent methyltransferase [Longimicrobium sp.]|nr:class I SAM-dependent methyltransferase [Longimicrobium sp.]